MRYIERNIGRKLGPTILGILILLMAALYIDLPQTTDFLGHPVAINRGIDLAGGARLLLCAAKNTNPSSSDMDIARNVINSRAAGGLGVTEPQVSRVGDKCIGVELAGLQNQDTAIQTIGKTGFLALTDSGTRQISSKVTLSCAQPGCAPGAKVGPTNLNANPPVLQVVVPGKYVSQGSAQVAFDSSGAPAVNYTLEGAGSDAWCTYTSSHVQGYSAIVLDNQVVSDPRIQSAICGGQTQINSLSSSDQARQIATYLNYGALPIALRLDSSAQVSASLGAGYVHEAYIAGIIGLIIVALFMLLYYRLPGLLADIALLMYVAFVFAVLKYLGVTLTLTGIAGFILSIGVAVDANVLIFERMKEELRAGKTLGNAIEAGFRRAWPSIRDSNVSTMITCVILFVFGRNFAASVITGFATTLFVGVLVSMLTAVFISHTILRVLVVSGYGRSAALFGVEPEAVGEQIA